MTLTATNVAEAGLPQQCMATAKISGRRCRRSPVIGSTVCEMHGGSAKQTAKKAEANAAVQKIAELEPRLFDKNAPPVTDPFAELARFAGICRNGVDYAGELVNSLEGRLRYMSPGQGAEQLRSEVAVLKDWMAMYSGVLTSMVKLGLEDRQVRVNERTADVFVQVMRHMLANPDLALTPAQQATAPRAMQESIKAVAGTEVEIEVLEA